VASRRAWFDEHNDGKRYRIVVAEAGGVILGSASSGRHRAKATYDTTVETSIACRPGSVGRGVGTRLYQALFAELAHEDIHRWWRAWRSRTMLQMRCIGSWVS